MGVSDMFDKAKDLVDQHDDKVDAAIDQGAEAVKKVTPDNVDGMVDKAADAAKGATGNDAPAP